MLNGTVGTQRAIARLRPYTKGVRAASLRRCRSLRAAGLVQAQLTSPQPRHVADVLELARRLLHPPLTAERALPIGIAALVAVAGMASYVPTGAENTGGPVGDAAPVRIAIAGAFGIDGTGQAPDQTGIDDPMLEAEPHQLDFRPLVLDSLDRITDAVQPATPAAAATVTGPFLADGTLVAGFAPETTVADGSALVRSYRVRAGDNLVGIASRFHVSMMSLWWANDLRDKDDLHIGQLLRIPPVSGVVVDVGPNDTLASLAAQYGVEQRTILDANGLVDPNLVLGQTLIIPGGRGEQIATQKSAARPVARPRTTGSNVSRTASRPSVRPPVTYGGGAMLWPVVGGGSYISQYFHYGHYGLDIASDPGSRVRAAAGGTVIFAGWKSNGGGYQVWIAHGSSLYTTYNHMMSLSVGIGEQVGRGDPVGRVGCSGNCTGPHLHFEVWIGPVWNGGYRVNPLRYL